MVYRVELTRRASNDLQRIFGFINGAESFAAARWFFALQDTIQSLSSLAERGTVTDYDPRLRYLLHGNKPHIYRVLYRIDRKSNCVRVVHIRHGARQPIKPKRA